MKRIAELRKEKNLNQTGLALKLNVSQKMISAYENGQHQPSISTLIQMSKIFGVSVDYLIGKSDVRTPIESFFENRLTEKEVELLEIFRRLDSDKKAKAFGILFALENLD